MRLCARRSCGWEASDRICGKRLRPLLPILVEAMERRADPPCLVGGRFPEPRAELCGPGRLSPRGRAILGQHLLGWSVADSFSEHGILESLRPRLEERR
jgi:hypothetical protein